MPQTKKILLLGDSHTYGDGLPDVGHNEPWKEFSKKTWPYYIFKEEFINNKSFPGNANDIISLNLVRNIDKTNLVIIMFTHQERQHLIRKGYNFVTSHNYTKPISDNGDENWVAKQIAEKDKERDQKFVLDNFDDNFLEIMFLKNILWCQFFCESKNIEYYFTMVTKRQKTKMKQSLELYRDSLYDSINWRNIFLIEGKYGFADYGIQTNAERGNDNSHFGIDYHKMFAGHFLDWINNKKQV